jgi:hypothetical protein
MENKVNFQIPETVVTEAEEGVAGLTTLLRPYLIALTPEDRSKLPRMGDGTVPFVQKCLDYCISDPQFAPPFMNKEELANDMKAHGQLTEIFRSVKQLIDGLDDTMMQAGAESYINALGYYSSVKQAAKANVPGAKAVYDDLKVRFAKKSKKKETEMPE